MSGTATIVNDHVRVKLSINLSKKIQEKIENGEMTEVVKSTVKVNQLDRIDEEETSKCSENVSDAAAEQVNLLLDPLSEVEPAERGSQTSRESGVKEKKSVNGGGNMPKQQKQP